MEKNTMKKRKLTIEEGLYLLLAGTALLALILYVSFCLDNLMHSDTTAEVILSKFLADRNELISKEWFYSTEIRVIYTQLVMVPLFKIFSSYRLVKLLSVFIYYAVLLYAWHMLTKRFTLEKKWIFLGLALLLAPLSNEYLDMMFIGCFYTTPDDLYVSGAFFCVKGKEKQENVDPGRYCIIHPFRASWHDGTTVSGKSVFADAACISVIPGFGKRRKQKGKLAEYYIFPSADWVCGHRFSDQ